MFEPWVFKKREINAQEKMDDPACNVEQLERTYRHFLLINGVLSGWRRLYQQEIRPRLSDRQTRRLLDIGSGGGDVPRQLAVWAARDGLKLEVTAIDADRRAIRYAEQLPPLPMGAAVQFRSAFSSDLVAEGQRFDFITSNHLLHHLSGEELTSLLSDCQQLCSPAGLVIHNDLERSAAAYGLFRTLTWPFFRGSFIRYDGLLSIRRSFTYSELTQLAPSGWQARRLVPFRNLLIYRA